MAERVRIVRLERHRYLDGRTQFFSVNPNDRRKRWFFFKPEEVPAFEGEVAQARMAWVSKGKWRITEIL